MALKVKRKCICLPPQYDKLLEELKKQTDLGISELLKMGLDLLAQKQGIPVPNAKIKSSDYPSLIP